MNKFCEKSLIRINKYLGNALGTIINKISSHTIDFYLVSLLIPIAFIVIGILAARLGRRDGDTSPLGNTYAVGTSVAIMCLSTAIVECFKAPSGSRETFLYWILIFSLFTWWSTDRDRYSSWERDQNGEPTDKKDTTQGIVVPNIVAIVLFVTYQITSV